MKNTLQGIISRVDETDDQISNLEVKEAENTQSEQQNEKIIQKKWAYLRMLCNKCTNINIMGLLVPWGYWMEKRESKKLKTYLKN